MDYRSAIEVLNEGKMVKLPEWTGYWFKQGDDIKALTRTGDIFPAWSGSRHELNVLHRNDWEETDGSLGFDFALLAMKAGKKVTRRVFETDLSLKGVYCELVDSFTFENLKIILWQIPGVGGSLLCPSLEAEQIHIMSNDWIIYEV